MTGVRFEMLLEVDPAVYRQAAVAWDRLARSLDDRADELTPQVKRIGDVWEGEAGEWAAAHCEQVRHELETSCVPVVAIAQALHRHADGLAELRDQAHALVADARNAQITINPDGSMTIAPGRSSESTARAMSSLVWQRDALLRAAADLDSRTARALAEDTATADGLRLARIDRAGIPAPGTDPHQVKAWWDGLTPEQQRYALATYPELVGGLDGVPVADRDIANRIMLDREEDRLRLRQGELDAREAHIRSMVEQGRGGELYPGSGNPAALALTELERIQAEREDISGKLRGMDNIEKRLESDDPNQPRAFLIGLSTAYDGKAIVSVGNPDQADNVLTYVPGTGSELSKVGGDINRADLMAQDATDAAPDQRTAAIMWLGYDAPADLPAAATGGHADSAVEPLSSFQDGLRATHQGEASHNTVLGHSYGTTAIGHTAIQKGINADELIFVASPGVGGTGQVADLQGVSPDHVWATRAEHDIIQVTQLAPDLGHEREPTNPGYGARVFSSDPGRWNEMMQTHSAYWDKGNVARTNIAFIVTGQGGRVS